MTSTPIFFCNGHSMPLHSFRTSFKFYLFVPWSAITALAKIPFTSTWDLDIITMFPSCSNPEKWMILFKMTVHFIWSHTGGHIFREWVTKSTNMNKILKRLTCQGTFLPESRLIAIHRQRRLFTMKATPMIPLYTQSRQDCHLLLQLLWIKNNLFRSTYMQRLSKGVYWLDSKTTASQNSQLLPVRAV